MLQLMKYCLLVRFRDKITSFWALFFPLILCTLFYVTFGDVDRSLDCIHTALVVRNGTTEAKSFELFLTTLEENADDFIETEEMSEEKAKSLLREGKIQGIYYADTEPELRVTGGGVEESVLQSLMESYLGYQDIIRSVAEEKPENLPALIEQVNSSAMEASYVKEASLGGKETDGMIQYFFSLIGMACMFGCFMGEEAPLKLQANISAVGARRCVGAASKLKLILADFLVICALNFVYVLILLGYMTGILKLDLGGDIDRILLVAFTGCLIGVSLGMLVGSIGRWSEGVKMATMLSVSLGSSFLSGLMVGGVKGLIEEYCPVINRINPASLISDAFYSISVYQDTARYTRDVLTMAVWAAVFLAGSFMLMRRVRYDSI